MNKLGDRLANVLKLLESYKSKENTVHELRSKVYNGDTGCCNDIWNIAMDVCDEILDNNDCEITIEEALKL